MSTQSAVDKWAEYQATKRENSAKKPKRKRCGACAAVYEGDQCPECHPARKPTLTIAPETPVDASHEPPAVAEPVPPPETEPRRECAACGRLYVPSPRPPGMSGHPPRRCTSCIEAGLQRGGVIRRRKLANVSAAAPATSPEPEPRTPDPAPAPGGNDPIDTILQAVASVRPGITVRFVYVEMSNT